MNTDSKKNENEQCTIPVVVCSVFSSNGSYIKFESSDFSGKELTKANFDMVIDWLKQEKEKYPDVFS